MRHLVIRFMSCLLTTIFVAGLSIPGAYALTDFQNGVSLYKQGKYAQAVVFFDREIGANPSDSSAVYYAADSYFRIGELSKAVILYNAIIEEFPNTVAATYSRKALLSVSRSLSNGHSPHAMLEKSVSTVGQSVGNQVVPFSREQSGHLVVSCMLNGHPQKMIFDTGASVCVATKDQLRSLNIDVPANSPVGMATGVSGTVKTWLLPVEIQLGELKQTVTMSVMDELPTLPLLGESFFGAYQYVVDNASGSIRFMKLGSESDSFVPTDTINVPFVRQEQELEVTARINGVSLKLFFDTGAERTVLPASVISQTDPQKWILKGYGTSEGVGGSGTCKAYQVGSIQVGSIRNFNFEVVVVDNLPIAHGLLGQDFFAHRKFTIDNERNVIRFWR